MSKKPYQESSKHTVCRSDEYFPHDDDCHPFIKR
jgi:hypothetical protein